MAKLSEKEIEIELGKFKANFLALYRDGNLDEILLALNINGNPMEWHYSSHLSHHPIVRLGKRTEALEVLKIALKKKYYKIIENQIKIYEA